MQCKLLDDIQKVECIALMVVGNIKAMGTLKEVLLPELIAEAYCLPVRVVQHPFLDIPLVLPETK